MNDITKKERFLFFILVINNISGHEQFILNYSTVRFMIFDKKYTTTCVAYRKNFIDISVNPVAKFLKALIFFSYKDSIKF
jgi:hypothetical protein